MLKTIRIGEKNYDMRASALTAIIYKNIFGADLIKALTNAKETNNLDLFKQLAFVMNWQAQKRQINATEALKSLSITDYYIWLDELEEMDFYSEEVLREITTLWLNNQKSVIEIKNANSQQ